MSSKNLLYLSVPAGRMRMTLTIGSSSDREMTEKPVIGYAEPVLLNKEGCWARWQVFPSFQQENIAWLVISYQFPRQIIRPHRPDGVMLPPFSMPLWQMSICRMSNSASGAGMWTSVLSSSTPASTSRPQPQGEGPRKKIEDG